MTYRCVVCGFETENRNKIRKHIKKEHQKKCKKKAKRDKDEKDGIKRPAKYRSEIRKSYEVI